jgi:hypothetical protein
MRIPVIEGIIKRRMLVNFRVDAAVMQRLLPQPFKPKLHEGYAIAGICLIRLEQIRPARLPAFLGVASENAAHRIAVVWRDSSGAEREGVFIPRRDTGSIMAHISGGRVFPGEHHLAQFDVADDGTRIEMARRSRDGRVSVNVRARDAGALPESSCFGSVEQASRFFQGGSHGYSVTSDPGRLDGLRLHVPSWHAGALDVEHVESSIFANTSLFPAGSATFDHALIMRDIQHQWHQVDDLFIQGSAPIYDALAGVATDPS